MACTKQESVEIHSLRDSGQTSEAQVFYFRPCVTRNEQHPDLRLRFFMSDHGGDLF